MHMYTYFKRHIFKENINKLLKVNSLVVKLSCIVQLPWMCSPICKSHKWDSYFSTFHFASLMQINIYIYSGQSCSWFFKVQFLSSWYSVSHHCCFRAGSKISGRGVYTQFCLNFLQISQWKSISGLDCPHWTTSGSHLGMILVRQLSGAWQCSFLEPKYFPLRVSV